MTEPQTLYERRTPVRARRKNTAYERLLRLYYGFLVPSGMRVLQLGCGDGDLLASLKPARGVGIDADPVGVEEARKRHPELEFHPTSEPVSGQEKFDYILLSDVVNYLPDVQAVLERLQRHSYQHTRIVLNV